MHNVRVHVYLVCTRSADQNNNTFLYDWNVRHSAERPAARAQSAAGLLRNTWLESSLHSDRSRFSFISGRLAAWASVLCSPLQDSFSLSKFYSFGIHLFKGNVYMSD